MTWVWQSFEEVVSVQQLGLGYPDQRKQKARKGKWFLLHLAQHIMWYC